jgi:glycosyltransferase involved in cell wall biosynthesis
MLLHRLTTAAQERARATGPHHVTVCVCTYKRPLLLDRLLECLGRQETDGKFTYSVVVVDNDSRRSAESVVTSFASRGRVAVEYRLESRQNIALARNKAVESARAGFVAFIDDDELPIERWLVTLFDACQDYGVDGVLGPVMPHFDERPPAWVVKGGFYDRARYPTGFVIDGNKGRTGNVLLKADLFEQGATAFRPEFLTGEDQDFFTRMIAKGRVFIWCDEAEAYEVVPPVRWKRSFMLRRALLSGATSLVGKSDARDIARSLIAVPAYALWLPFTVPLGHAQSMRLLVKLFDHLGKLLAAVGIKPIKDQYVTE